MIVFDASTLVGAAIGPDGFCYVCNNGGFAWTPEGDETGLRPVGIAPDYGGGRIERVDLATGAVEVLRGSGLRRALDSVLAAHGLALGRRRLCASDGRPWRRIGLHHQRRPIPWPRRPGQQRQRQQRPHREPPCVGPRVARAEEL